MLRMNTENVLLLGSGGREHALALAMRSSPSCGDLWCAPGNPGIAEVATIVDIAATDIEGVLSFVRSASITLVVVGPEQPLERGLADVLRAEGVAVFGPGKTAAQIETSKGFAKDLMQSVGVPTASYRRFAASQWEEARAYVESHELPVVIKADGLAAGKGVVVAATSSEAVTALEGIFGGAFGESGAEVVIEDFLIGEEASLFAVTDGTSYVVLAPAQDHKRIADGDTGKNTGGMGAYAPAPIVTASVQRWAEENIIEPTLRAMRERGMPFVGCLFAGLMVHDDGTSSVVEFNCRFGDPETQSVLAVLDADVVALFAGAARGALDPSTIGSTAYRSACTVVLASYGYPDAVKTGFPIVGLDAVHPNVLVHHAGTKSIGPEIVTAGGRVLGITGFGATLADAREAAYAAVTSIDFDGKTYRSDIGNKGLRRLEQL